jgi:hypothetical protein
LVHFAAEDFVEAECKEALGVDNPFPLLEVGLEGWGVTGIEDEDDELILKSRDLECAWFGLVLFEFAIGAGGGLVTGGGTVLPIVFLRRPVETDPVDPGRGSLDGGFCVEGCCCGVEGGLSRSSTALSSLLFMLLEDKAFFNCSAFFGQMPWRLT